MQCLVTEPRAWLFLANTVLPTQGDLLGRARDGGANTKGERGQRSHPRSRRVQPMAALPGVRGKSQVSLPATALTPVSMAVLLVSPACQAHHTPGLCSGWTQVKNTAGSKTRTGAAAQIALLSLPSRPSSLPSTRAGRAKE